MIIPVLKSEREFKTYKDYVLIYGDNPSELDILHPSEACILSLCNGKHTTEDLKFLAKEIYSLSSVESEKIIEGILTSKRHHLSILDERVERKFTHDTKKFIYHSDESIFWDAKRKFLPYPAGINISVTLKCNFRCIYCYQSIESYQNVIPFEKCIDLIDQARELNAIYVGITGGEPTLHPQWIGMLSAIIKHDMLPVLTSNGYVIGSNRDIAGMLQDIGLRRMTISLDTSIPELHDSITRSNNTFYKVIEAIESLVKSGIIVDIKHVLTIYNYENLNDYIDFVVNLGVNSIGISAMEGGALNSRANDISEKITPEHIMMAKNVVDVKNKLYADKCRISPPRDIFNSWDEQKWYPCGGLSTGMSIFPDGDVTICDKLHGIKEFTYGNVFQDRLIDIWQGDALENLRKKSIDKNIISNDCATCDVLSLCKTGCFVDSFNSSNDYFDKHPNCKGPFNKLGITQLQSKIAVC